MPPFSLVAAWTTVELKSEETLTDDFLYYCIVDASVALKSVLKRAVEMFLVVAKALDGASMNFFVGL